VGAVAARIACAVYVPATFDSPAACMMRAQAYVANSSIGRDLPKSEALKVMCVRGSINRVDKAESGPGSWGALMYSHRALTRCGDR
jgi:hypothetical protein